MITYKDVLDRKFKRVELEDSVHFDTYGYKMFVMELEFDNVLFNWTSSSQEVLVYKNNSYTDIRIIDLQYLDKLIKLFD